MRTLTPDHPDRWVRRHAGPALALTLALICVATLAPFEPRPDAALAGAGPFGALWALIRGESNLDDIIHNVVLFLPLGYLLRAYGEERGLGPAARVALVAAAACGVSLLIELAQLWLPARFSSLIDVAANTGGALLGAGCFGLARQWSRSPRALAAGGAAYYGLALLAAVALQGASSLRGWDESYPLWIGNEGNGKRPWHGYVAQARAASVALNAEAARGLLRGAAAPAFDAASVFDYRLAGPGPFADRAGRLPALGWRSGGPARAAQAGAALDARHWLWTAGPAAAATRAIRESAAFTLDLTLAALSADQSGPARILSISQNNSLRNLTVGQDGDDLVVRLRTEANGPNGTRQTLRVPGVFATEELRRVVVTYGRARLTAYVSGLAGPYAIDLAPEPELLRWLLPGSVGDLAQRLPASLYLAIGLGTYAALLGLPLGATVAWAVGRATAAGWAAAAGAAALIPALSELIVAGAGGRDPRLANLLAPSLLAVSSLSLFGWRAVRRSAHQAVSEVHRVGC